MMRRKDFRGLKEYSGESVVSARRMEVRLSVVKVAGSLRF